MAIFVRKIMQLNPLILLLLYGIAKEIFYSLYRHNSASHNWSFPTGLSFVRLSLKILTVLSISSLMVVVLFFFWKPVNMIVTRTRTYLLGLFGCSDMLYHA